MWCHQVELKTKLKLLVGLAAIAFTIASTTEAAILIDSVTRHNNDDSNGVKSHGILVASAFRSSNPQLLPSAALEKGIMSLSSLPSSALRLSSPILNARSISSSPSPSSLPSATHFTVWTDPNENAFTMLLPQGWKATGGTLRTISGTNDADFWFNATDPTKKEIVFAADALAYYILPSPLLGPDGSIYPGSTLAIPTVYNYRSASDYIRQFVMPSLKKSASPDIQIVKITDYPIPNSSSSSSSSPMTVITQATGATAILSFTKDNEKYTIGVDVVTLGWATGWDAIAFAAAAPQNDFDSVTKLASMIIPSFTEKTDWVKNEIVQKEVRTGIRIGVQQYLENSINQRYAEKNAVTDATSQAWSEAMLGTHQVRNSATGDIYTVPNNYQYWWGDAHGNLVGTVSDSNPDPKGGFVKLQEQKPVQTT